MPTAEMGNVLIGEFILYKKCEYRIGLVKRKWAKSNPYNDKKREQIGF